MQLFPLSDRTEEGKKSYISITERQLKEFGIDCNQKSLAWLASRSVDAYYLR